MKVLLGVEAQTLAEGREWTRQRLEERLQAQADQIGIGLLGTGQISGQTNATPFDPGLQGDPSVQGSQPPGTGQISILVLGWLFALTVGQPAEKAVSVSGREGSVHQTELGPPLRVFGSRSKYLTCPYDCPFSSL